MSILADIDTSVNNYLSGDIDNPLLKKVIEDEITFSNNLETIFNKYFSDVVESANYNDKLNNLSNLIKNVSYDTRNILRTYICNTFIELSSDQHMFLIISINDNIKNIFELFSNDPSIIDILKYIVSGISIGINKEEYVIKCIDACSLINKKISTQIVIEYIHNNGVNLITNDKLLIYFINYIVSNNFIVNESNLYYTFINLITIKLSSIKEKIDKMSLDTMDVAFEIYKLGKIVIDSNLKYNQIDIKKLLLTDAQNEYIVKAIHTCILNNNINQAKALLAIVYYIPLYNMDKFVKYYNKSLVLRINMSDTLAIEYNMWNINNQYDTITTGCAFLSYNQNINNIKYSNIINNELTKIQIKNSKVNMKNVTVKLVTQNEHTQFESIVHHPKIKEYLDGLNRYFMVKSYLQNIQHNMEKSNIKIRTSMGSISCSLIFGSILLHLNDKDMDISELSNLLKINEIEITKRIKSLIKYNIVVKINSSYKYTPPYGDIECEIIDINDDIETNNVNIEKFTDIIMTTDSRIIKEVKPNKMNKMELERRVQEFLGTSYVRNIFYDRLESLKKRYYIKETDSIIEYVV